MSPSVINLILKAIDANGEAVFSREDLAAWPKEDFDEALRTGLLEEAAPADEVVCPRCEEACLEDVQFVHGDKPADTRAYVICGQRDDIGPVWIPLEMLDRWAVNRQQAKKLRLNLKEQEKPPRVSKKPRLARPLLKTSKLRDRMLDELSKNAKHREAYGIVYDHWDQPHDDIIRTIQTETGLELAHQSRISQMKSRVVKWFEGTRPQSAPGNHDSTVEKILGKLRSIYVQKGAVSLNEWEDLAGTHEEPGEVRSEISANLIEDGGETKALAAGRSLIDKYRRERGRTDHQHDVDGQPVDSHSD